MLRLLAIICILIKNNCLFIFNIYRPLKLILLPISFTFPGKKKQPEILARTLEELGPFFIKIGQVLSCRLDILGPEYISALSKLRDKLPPFSKNELEAIFIKNLGKKPQDIYKDFEINPVSAASVAQVHKALTPGEEVVAVKVLRPGIKKRLMKDIKLVLFLLRMTKIFFSKKEYEKYYNIVKAIERGINIELDLKNEGAAAVEMRNNISNHESTYIPKIYWHFSSEEILTMEWVNGISIYEIEKLKENKFDLTEIAKNLAITFFNQAYKDGFFHSDLHPGNILVGENNQIILVDFGINCRLTEKLRFFLANMIYSFIKKDYKEVADLYYRYEYIPTDKSYHSFVLACTAMGERIVDRPVRDISLGNLLGEMIKLSREFEIIIEPEFFTLQKTIFIIEGIGYQLNPEINMWDLVRPWIEDWAIENISVEAKIFNKLKNLTKNFIKALQ